MSTQEYTVRALIPVSRGDIVYNPGDVFTVEKTEEDISFVLAQGLYELVEDTAPKVAEEPKKKAKAPKAAAQATPAESVGAED